ncbi:hypothetical protein [Helicobacter cinaedi]|uniref:hypothetical protein n=1 Tax=Helicobacter cinaedi TaxID=213 RepID=UPI001FB20E5A|nr:hypothetical protein [Helicobacter cinaedi]
MLRKNYNKLEEISREFLWAIELIPEARELKLDKRLSLVEVESEWETESDRGIFNILLDDEIELSRRKLYTDYGANSVMALLEILNSFLEDKKEFKLFKVDGDTAIDFDTKTQYDRHDACNIVFFLDNPVEDYDLQQEILETSSHKLGVCEDRGNLVLSDFWSDCGIVEVSDIEGDLYIIHEREKAESEIRKRAEEALIQWEEENL